MKPIYEPKARAKEYGDLAINIYTGCNHGCTYCFAEKMANRWGKDFTKVEPRKGVVEAVKAQLEREHITDKLIHLCFTCDPYPAEIDTTPTREIIKLIKDSGNHIQILTKGGRRAERDFDLLDSEDWFGVTYSGNTVHEFMVPTSWEPNADTVINRLCSLSVAHKRGIKTWMSIEPVIDATSVLNFLELDVGYVDKYKIGKLNYYPSDIDWGKFGQKCERICKVNGLNYYIKDDLRNAMLGGET